MRSLCKALLFLCFIPGVSNAATKTSAAPSGIETFNQALDSATRHLDNAAVLALWEDDGVSLLPSTPPIMGKKAIGKFLDDVMAQYPGGRMEKFEMQCHDIEVSGDWGSEWCTEHQIVRFPGGKPPFEGWGKMLFVLHRGADGKWRVKEEMWNQAMASPAAAHS
jgi:ketosteroid isomerase-like protein